MWVNGNPLLTLTECEISESPTFALELGFHAVYIEVCKCDIKWRCTSYVVNTIVLILDVPLRMLLRSQQTQTMGDS